MRNKMMYGVEENGVCAVYTVHGAIEIFRESYTSLIKSTRLKCIFVVDDSDQDSDRQMLLKFLRSRNECVRLVSYPESRLPIGYTKSINSGIKIALRFGCNYIVQINSDTLFGKGWLEPMIETLETEAGAAAVGPLSNAATYQSIPELANASGWVNNVLQDGWTVNHMCELVFLLSDNRPLEMPILGGFVILYPSSLFQKIGLFDERVSPMGYGDEVDFAFRIKAARRKMFVHPSSYVFHLKGKSFTTAERSKYVEESKQKLFEKYSHFQNQLRGMKLENVLSSKREQITKFLHPASLKALNYDTSVLFILNPMGKEPKFHLRGGWVSVMQEAQGLAQNGFYARVAVPMAILNDFAINFPLANADGTFIGFNGSTPEEVASFLSKLNLPFTFLVATHWTTVNIVFSLLKYTPNSIPSYYVQDIETSFGDSEGPMQSYIKFQRQGFVFTKTAFLQTALKDKFSLNSYKIQPTLDETRFKPVPRNFDAEKLSLCSMVRMSTPRRQPLETITILNNIAERLAPATIISIFGSSIEELQEIYIHESIEILGILTSHQIDDLYHRCHIFFDFSAWQAFGRSGLDFMATGGIPILPQNGGVTEYATDLRNSFIIDTTSMLNAETLLHDILHKRYNLSLMSSHAMADAKKFHLTESGRNNAALFREVKQKIRLQHHKGGRDNGFVFHAHH